MAAVSILSLQGAPLVIEQRKTIPVRVAGDFGGSPSERIIGQKERFDIDMTNQGYADIQFLLREITVKEAIRQEKIDNPPTRIAVDNYETKPLKLVKRKVEVAFGNVLDQVMIRYIERSVQSAVASLAAVSADSGLGSPALWEWLYIDNPRKSRVGVSVNPLKLKAMKPGSQIVYKPTSTNVGVANMMAARKAAGWDPNRWLWGKGRSGGKGFMSASVDKMKRGYVLKNYTIRAGFTHKHRLSGEPYRRTSKGGAITPIIVVTARRNRRYRRIRR